MPDVVLTIPPERMTVVHAWNTSVKRNLDGSEKRAALFTWPRLAFSLTYAVHAADKNRLRRNLYRYANGTWAIPIFPDRCKLTAEAASGQANLAVDATAHRRFYEGRDVVILDPADWTTYEIGTINTGGIAASQLTLDANLSATRAAGAHVYPIIDCRIGNAQQLAWTIGRQGEFTLEAVEAYETARSFSYTLPTSGAATYNGKDLFLFSPIERVGYGYERPLDMVRFLGIGYSESLYDEFDPVRPSDMTFGFVHRPVLRENIAAFRNFFDSKRGRLTGFYAPTWNNDLVVTAAVADTDATLTVENSDYADGRHVFIQFPDGTYACREVLSVTDTGVTLDSAVGTAVAAGDLSRLLVSFLNLVRFSDDRLTLNHPRESAAKARVAFKTFASEETARPGEIYHFYTDGGFSAHYTSGDVSVTVDSRAYSPASISRDRKEGDTTLEISKMVIAVDHDDAIVQEYKNGVHKDVLWVSVDRIDRDDAPYTKSNIFKGQVKSVTFDGVFARLECVGLEFFLSQEIPRFRYQTTCNWDLFDDRCGLDKTAYKTTTTVTVSSDGYTLTSADFGALGDSYLYRGWIETTDGHRRRVTAHEGDDVTLYFPIPDLETGDSVDAYPGCHQDMETCRDKFGNIDNYGGHPYIPLENPVTRT